MTIEFILQILASTVEHQKTFCQQQSLYQHTFPKLFLDMRTFGPCSYEICIHSLGALLSNDNVLFNLPV